VRVNAFQTDLLAFRLKEEYDILFSTGVLHCIPPELRGEVLGNYKQFTRPGGLNVFSVFVRKPFIGKAPDSKSTSHKWISGELFTHYHDWRMEFITEQVFDCASGGVAHQHAVNRMIARKEA